MLCICLSSWIGAAEVFRTVFGPNKWRTAIHTVCLRPLNDNSNYIFSFHSSGGPKRWSNMKWQWTKCEQKDDTVEEKKIDSNIWLPEKWNMIFFSLFFRCLSFKYLFVSLCSVSSISYSFVVSVTQLAHSITILFNRRATTTHTKSIIRCHFGIRISTYNFI